MHENCHLFVACQQPVVKLHADEWGHVSYLTSHGEYHADIPLTINAVPANNCPILPHTRLVGILQREPNTQ
jgi:hypothetical protein